MEGLRTIAPCYPLPSSRTPPLAAGARDLPALAHTCRRGTLPPLVPPVPLIAGQVMAHDGAALATSLLKLDTTGQPFCEDPDAFVVACEDLFTRQYAEMMTGAGRAGDNLKEFFATVGCPLPPSLSLSPQPLRSPARVTENHRSTFPAAARCCLLLHVDTGQRSQAPYV